MDIVLVSSWRAQICWYAFGAYEVFVPLTDVTRIILYHEKKAFMDGINSRDVFEYLDILLMILKIGEEVENYIKCIIANQPAPDCRREILFYSNILVQLVMDKIRDRKGIYTDKPPNKKILPLA